MHKNNPSKIHALAQYFTVRGGLGAIVLLTDNHKAAIAQYPSNAHIFLLQTPKSYLSTNEINQLPPNVIPFPLGGAGPEFLKDKVFVCIDYLERRRYLYRDYGHRSVVSVAKYAALSIWAVKPGRSWNIRKLRKLNHNNKTALLGKTAINHRGSDKHLVAIAGRLTDIYGADYPLVPVLAIISQFNEVDIIEPVLKHLLCQGVDVYVIDNWSNDGSYEAVQKLVKLHPSRVSCERFPLRDNQKYEWAKILNRVTEVAKEKPGQYKWIISNDADEIRWSFWNGVSLQKAISFVDYLGYNVIDYTVFNFSPTKDGFKQGLNPLKFFKYGDFGHEGWHFMQLKTWKNNPKADIASSSGHLVKFPHDKIFPLKFLLGHYSLRSNEQARKKIFKDRKPRFVREEKKKGWHSHYNGISEDMIFIHNKNDLIPVRRGVLPEEYLLERIAGIGITVNEIGK